MKFQNAQNTSLKCNAEVLLNDCLFYMFQIVYDEHLLVTYNGLFSECTIVFDFDMKYHFKTCRYYVKCKPLKVFKKNTRLYHIKPRGNLKHLFAVLIYLKIKANKKSFLFDNVHQKGKKLRTIQLKKENRRLKT